jgi:hypothetical protein
MTTNIRKHQRDNVNALIYPNPSDGIFRVKVSSDSLADFIILIFNMNGQAVYSGKWDAVLNLDQEIDLSHLSKGMYTVEVIKNGISNAYKLTLR